MRKTALLTLPEKRIQESGEALGGVIKENRQQAAQEAAHTLQDAQTQLPVVLPFARERTLYVQLDGGRINTTTSGWREPKVATLFWGDDVVEESKARRTILNKEYIATLEDADHIATLLWEAACRWEWWRAKRVVVLGDGAPWIWNRAGELFPDAVQILDLYHAKEHIWKVARVLYGGRGKQKDKAAGKKSAKSAKDRRTEDWANERCYELENGRFDDVIKKLNRCRPKNDEAQQTVDELIHYLQENRCRMDYAKYRSEGLNVGSGAIESGVKNVVNQRMKGCGMRWAEDKAENMLHLRSAHLSDVGPFAQLNRAA